MLADGIHHLQFLLLILLIFVSGLAALAGRFKIPYPIFLVIGGLLLSLVPGIPRFHLNPEIIFVGFLPPLLFSAAFVTSWRDLKNNLVSILMLAFGLVAFTVVGVSLAAHYFLPGFDWAVGLVLGAVVCTTDAIAATSIAKRVGLPKRIIDILEGESLVNDVSGLLALEFSVAIVVTGHTPTLTEGALRLIWLMAGGIGIGLLLGMLIHALEKRIDDGPIEITVSILTPYAAYLLAEAFNTSGVLATVVCGLYLGRQSSEYFSSRVRLESTAVWNTIDFVLNGVVFILIGLQLPWILAGIRTMNVQHLLFYSAIFSAFIILLRLVWMYPATRVAYFIRTRFLKQVYPSPSKRQIFIIGWTGMRGVLALAAAVSLPEVLSNGEAFPQRNFIIFLCFSVILVTLVLQGLTLPAIIRRLGLAGEAVENCEEDEARRLILDGSLNQLEEMRATDKPEFDSVYDALAQQYRQRLDALGCGDPDNPGSGSAVYNRYREVAHQLRVLERAHAIDLRNQGRISDEILRTLERELDLLDIGAPAH